MRSEKPWCDDCQFFHPWLKLDRDIPSDFNPCSLGHKMRFRQPNSPSDTQWGFWKADCPDREEKECHVF